MFANHLDGQTRNFPSNIEEAHVRITELQTQLDNLISNMSFGFFLYEIVPDSTGQNNIRALMVNQKMAD